MKQLFRLAAFASLLLATALLPACSSADIEQFTSGFHTGAAAITATKVPANDIVAGIQAFDLMKISATGYNTMRRCTGNNGPFCRDPAMTEKIDVLIQEGTRQRNLLKEYVRNNPDGFGPQDAYDKLLASTSALKGLISVYTATNPR